MSTSCTSTNDGTGSSGQDLIGDLAISFCTSSIDNALKTESSHGNTGEGAGSLEDCACAMQVSSSEVDEGSGTEILPETRGYC